MKTILKNGMLVGMLILGMLFAGCSKQAEEDVTETEVTEIEVTEADVTETAEDTEVAGTDESADSAVTTEESENDAVTEEETSAGICNMVFMGGASFTGMEPLQTDNYEDGTYYYADKHTDGTLTIINCAMAVPEEEFASSEDMIVACIERWSPNGTNQDIVVTSAEDYTAQFSNPAYTVTWTESGDGETVNCNAVAVQADGFVYAYMFKESSTVEESMNDLYPDIFSGLTLQVVE